MVIFMLFSVCTLKTDGVNRYYYSQKKCILCIQFRNVFSSPSCSVKPLQLCQGLVSTQRDSHTHKAVHQTRKHCQGPVCYPAWLGAARRHRRLLRHPGMSLQLKEATKQSKHHSNAPVQHREPLGGTSRAQAEKHSTGKKHPWENQTTASPLD